MASRLPESPPTTLPVALATSHTRSRASWVLGVGAALVWLGLADCRTLATEVPSAPHLEDVHLAGRFDTNGPGGPRFAWSGSSVSTHFTGTSISARLHDDGTNVFQVIVDGTPTSTLGTGPSRELYPLAMGLSPGEHRVELYKRTEARVGEVQFVSFVPTQGERLVPSSPNVTRRIELIGDSITAGYGNEGLSPTCAFSPATENEYATYGAVASRELDAEHVTLAWSGRTSEGMAQVYDRILPARADSRWDFHAWTPDVVIVNLGTNDFMRGDPGNAFVAAYSALLGRVRSHYPNALLVSALGPMLADTYPPGAMNLTHARRYLTRIVEEAHTHGDARVVFLEFPTQDPTTSGCGFHPTVATHRLMATQLIAMLRAQMGW